MQYVNYKNSKFQLLTLSITNVTVALSREEKGSSRLY
jgi:hypothetical protein